MRITVVAPEFPPDIGGVETYAFEYSKELVRRGHEVTVFTPPRARGHASLPGALVRPVLTQCKNLDRQIFSDHPADVWHVMNAAYSWLASEVGPTIVSVHGNDFLRPYIPVATYSVKRLPYLWRLGDLDSDWLKPYWFWRTRRLMALTLPRAKHIVANSQYTERALLNDFPDCRGNTSVAYVGVAERFFSIEHTLSRDGVARLLTVCRLSEARKNVDMVLRALAKLKEKYLFTYTVVGDGHVRAHLERLTQDLGLPDRVRFTGFVSQDNLLNAYSQADLFVLTSSILPGSHEGFGIAYLEAAASGVPSLAARLAGAAEAVSEGVSGMFVEEPSVEAIALALATFFDRTTPFDRQACRRFAEQFSWRKVVDHVLKYYD